MARMSCENGFNQPYRTGSETIWRNSAFPTRPWTRSKFRRSTAKTALWRASKATLRESRSTTDIPGIVMLRRPFGSIVALLAACASAPVALPPFTGGRAIPRVLAVEAVIGVAIVVLSVIGAAIPSLVPALPAAGSPAAIALFAVGLVVFAALAIRATHTFLLTRRFADL